MRRSLIAVVSLLILVKPALPSEADAIAISANIRAKHMPFGAILDPIYVSPTSNQIVGYTRCGDSALWTGAFLAAESFRYKVTQSADALDNVKTALAGLKGLADVTFDNRLARCMVLANSPYAAGIQNEEAHNTIHQAAPWIWVDNTSRDEVVGAFFGLATAFDLVDDPSVKAGVSDLATRLIGFVAHHQWSPNDDISNTFVVRPEELQMLLQVARHVNPSNNISGPFLVPPVDTAVRFDVGSNDSYFKFNLDYMSFYNLIRLQNNDDNKNAYRIVRDYTASHQNAFFDIIDRALNGPNAARDVETRSLLDQWLQRSNRDFPVDLTGTVPVCGKEACQPVPVPMRPPTDFLWQRDPFQLIAGGDGFIESPGIDYILPYWMARYYGVLPASAVQSAAAASVAVAPELAGLDVWLEPGAGDGPGNHATAAVDARPNQFGGNRFERRAAQRPTHLCLARADKFRGARWLRAGLREFRSDKRIDNGNSRGHDPIRGAHTLQREQHGQRRRGRHGDSHPSRETRIAISHTRISVHQLRLCPGADCPRRRHASFPDALRHGDSQSKCTGKCCGEDQQHERASAVRGSDAEFRRPRSGECEPDS